MKLQKIERQLLVPYTCEQVFGVVSDIDDYSQFVPWCVSSRIIEKGDHTVTASLGFSKGGMQKSFTTFNRITPCSKITMDLIDGPFNHLSGVWRFEPRGDHCFVQFDLEFSFSNRIVAMMFGAVFHQIASSLVDSFYERAVEVYGKD